MVGPESSSTTPVPHRNELEITAVPGSEDTPLVVPDAGFSPPLPVASPTNRNAIIPSLDKLVSLERAGLWTGEGPPPDYIPGASPGDEYIDTLTGDLYRLDAGA